MQLVKGLELRPNSFTSHIRPQKEGKKPQASVIDMLELQGSMKEDYSGLNLTLPGWD